MNVNVTGKRVIGLGHQRREFQLIEALAEFDGLLPDLGQHGGVALADFGKFQKIGGFPLNRIPGIHHTPKRVDPRHVLLSGLGVVPEIGLGSLKIQLLKARTAFSEVKDSPGSE
jgi:hypothetical protein